MIVINKIVIYMHFHKNLHGARLLGHPVYFFICLRPDGPYNTVHIRKRLSFYSLKTFNMTYSATPLYMVNYRMGEKV